MNERKWAREAPIRDVVLAAILRGLDGYPDDNRTRPKFVLSELRKAGAIPEGPMRAMTVGELRRWAQDKFGEPGSGAVA